VPLEPLAPGDPATVGPHRLLGRLGQGGMGTVFLAMDPQDRVVAVKVLRDGPSDLEGRRRFRRELEVLQRVRGPHLVEVLGGDAEARTPWLVTRFVPGRRLDEVVAEGGGLVGSALVRVALGVARGLQALHRAGVVHRDLTPGNVLLVDGEPHVIDLGLAVVCDVTALTRSGLVVGTAGYLAPEQVLGAASGPAADVHAWGATLALAGTGRPPYGTGRPEAVLYRVVHSPPDLEGLPDTVAGLVRRALSKDAGDRPSVIELVAELEPLSARRLDLVGARSGPHPVLPAAGWTAPGSGVRPPATSMLGTAGALGRDATTVLRPGAGGAAALVPGAAPGEVSATRSPAPAGADVTTVLAPARGTPARGTPVLPPLPGPPPPGSPLPGPLPPGSPLPGSPLPGPLPPGSRLPGPPGRAVPPPATGLLPPAPRHVSPARPSCAGEATAVLDIRANPLPARDVSSGGGGPWGWSVPARAAVLAGALDGRPGGGPHAAVRTGDAGRACTAAVAVAAAVAAGAGALVVPALVAVLALAGLVVLQTAARTRAQRERMVALRGSRRRDGVVAVLALPWRLLLAAGDLALGLPLLLVGAGVPAAAALLLVDGPGGPAAAVATATVLGTGLTLARARFRASRRALAEGITWLLPGRADSWVAAGALLVVAVLLVPAASAGPHWWPVPASASFCLPLLPCG